MNWINVILTSLSMSVDAMTISAVDGLQEKNMRKTKTISIALLFGLMQFLMPVIGYFIGYSFKDALEAYIPWIAFALLSLLGIKSFIDWLKDRKKEKEEVKEACLKPGEIFLQGIATSIDALCIGFVYLDLDIPDAVFVFAIIGITTFALSFLTGIFSNKLADKLEKWAGLIAAIVFVCIGLKILLDGIL